jgi:hypothetical protein
VVGLVVLKFLGGGIVFGASLLGLALGVALLTNRKGLAERLQRNQERDVVDWSGPVSLLHRYFHRVVRLYALGLIAWGAFFPGMITSIWLGPHPTGVVGAVAAVSFVGAAVSFVGMFAVAFAMGWQSERAMGALGLPFLSLGLRRVRSAPWQVNATFCGALSVGVLVDVAVAQAVRIG